MNTKTHKPIKLADLPTDYAGLIALLPPRPIHNRGEYDEAVEMIDALAGHKLNRDQSDYLDILSDCVAKYDDEHFAMDTSGITPLEALKYLLDLHGLMTPTQLGELLESDRSLGYRILNRQRDLSKAHIRTLTERFRVSADLFMR